MNKVWKATFVIIGTIIGAGFASGQEILLFFCEYGNFGIISLIFSCMLSGWIIYKTLEFVRKEKIATYQEMLTKLLSSIFLVKTIQIIITTFLGICFIIMVAGFGAYFSQEFNLPNSVGCVILCLLFLIAYRSKTSGLIKANEFCIPILMILIITLGVYAPTNLTHKFIQGSHVKCMFDSILYASYNSITLIPILIELQDTTKIKKNNIETSLLCTFLLIVLGTTIFCIVGGAENTKNAEIPMLVIAKNAGNIFSHLYGIVILAAMYTSAISSGYGFLQSKENSTKNNIRILALCCVAIAVSRLGFTNLINILYPIFGFLGIVQMFFILKS